MSLETRSNSALMKRAEQLKRWQDSETFREPGDLKRKKRRIGFSDGCVFLAACAAGDKEEVKNLISRGTDIDTANVDGLTALHQACIDDNLDMVEFLVANGADVNRGDNEGWTPLHATASCGFLSIAKFLLEAGADVAAVNNDGELAIDISESDEMEDLLQKEIDSRSINCEEARNLEEQCMLNDARDWYNSGFISDSPHMKTGASALHVAAAKGYMKVINLLIQSGMEVNIQDYDGWTPLHAAAHWAQREACELLADNYSNMDIKNCVGQTPFDVADPDVLRLLEELKKKQNTLQKDRPDIKALINRPPTTPNTNRAGRSLNNYNNSNHVDIIRNSANNLVSSVAPDRSSITRLSQQDKFHSTKEATVKETIKEEKSQNNLEAESDKESSTDTSESDELSLPGLALTTPFHTARIYQSSISCKASRVPDSPGLVVTDESGKEAPGFVPPHPESSQGKDDAAPWRRPGSLRARPTNSGKLSPSTDDLVTVRRAHSFGSDEKRKVSEDIISKQSPDLRPRSIENLSHSRNNSGNPPQVRRSSEISLSSPGSGPELSSPLTPENGVSQTPQGQGLSNMFKTFFKSFVPPVRDEEHEIQRKAHAKRVRETRRSTQGVTLEDLKSAEQLVKKKQQQENAQRTTELQQLASPAPASPALPGSTASTTVTTSATLVAGSDADKQERRPSWRLRMESSDKNRNVPVISSQSTQELKKSNLKSQNGELDYKKLWEESQTENSKLKSEMNSIRTDLNSTRHQLETAIQASTKNSISDSEKREKKILEKKLAEMEEELKQLQKLKSENEKLKSENRALTRVVSKLTAAATKAGSGQHHQESRAT